MRARDGSVESADEEARCLGAGTGSSSMSSLFGGKGGVNVSVRKLHGLTVTSCWLGLVLAS